MKELKYLALGILVGYLTPYLLTLIKSLAQSSQTSSISEEAQN